MKIPLLLLASLGLLRAEEERVNLDQTSMKNLGIKTFMATEMTFEHTFFAIGALQEIPSNHSVVSSRIAGRVVDLKVIAGDRVSEGDEILKVESRQPGGPIITLKAPASGIIAESHVRLGEPVDPSKELLDILDLSQLWAIARVPQQEAGKLDIGTKARIQIPALKGETIEGKLVRFGTEADPSSGTFDAIFLIQNPDLKLRPGMRSEFSIITSVREDITVVPIEAVQGDLANRVVYVQDFDLPNSFIKAPVVTGEQNDRFIEIKEGLYGGVDVVTQGAYLLGFAGGGNLSLKEALDAAHGHEHNEDGSEISDGQKKGAPTDDDHGHGVDAGPINKFLVMICVILGALLVLSGIRQFSLERQLRNSR
ncbi:MAG: cobalt-zinc-cadmium efflux system membrane fusion protein [Paracoccaceae bacterium]|jgi:cobalt-zinc-cadmium efflux system membrane fusion protein